MEIQIKKTSKGNDSAVYKNYLYYFKRTNNHVEGYNLKLKKLIGAPHPNIWKLLEMFKAEEMSFALKKIRLDSDILKTRGRNKKDIEMDLKIEHLKVDYLKNELGLMEYISNLAKLVHDYSE
jgi:hypothetical protein